MKKLSNTLKIEKRSPEEDSFGDSLINKASLEEGCAGGVSGPSSTPVGLGEGQTLIANPVRKREANEAYSNDGHFDEDQELTIQVLRELGQDIEPYVTPDNSPEQMFELGNAITLGIPEDRLYVMADPQVSFMALQVINKAWKRGIDLTVYLPWADPNVLNQALLAAQAGLDLSKLIKPGLDHRQIEQMRKELEAGKDPSGLSGDYNHMRAQRFPESNISNIRNPIPKGMGTSGRKKGGKN